APFLPSGCKGFCADHRRLLLLEREITGAQINLRGLHAGVAKAVLQLINRASGLEPMDGMPVPQVMEAKGPEVRPVVRRPFGGAGDDRRKLAGEILVALARGMPEQERRADIGGQGALQVVALEWIERDGAALVALAGHRQLPPVVIDVVAACP